MVKLKGESYLLKIHIENGEIIHISMGNKTRDEILSMLREKEIEDLNFIPGIKPVRKNEFPLTAEVLRAFDINIDGIYK